MIGIDPSGWIKSNVVAPLLELARTEMDQLRTDAIAALERKFDELEPKIIEAAVTAVGHGMGSLIPGKADDHIINDVIGDVFNVLGIRRP